MEFKDVIGYEGIYVVSKCGVIKSLDHKVYNKKGEFVRTQKGRILKVHKSQKGYLRVKLSKKGKYFSTGVHRLVLSSFSGYEKGRDQVNHIDGDKTNNRLENLEWCTNSENQLHAVKNKLHNPNYGEKHHLAKLSNKQVRRCRHLHKNKNVKNNELASLYEISETAMSNILRNKTYVNV